MTTRHSQRISFFVRRFSLPCGVIASPQVILHRPERRSSSKRPPGAPALPSHRVHPSGTDRQPHHRRAHPYRCELGKIQMICHQVSVQSGNIRSAGVGDVTERLRHGARARSKAGTPRSSSAGSSFGAPSEHGHWPVHRKARRHRRQADLGRVCGNHLGENQCFSNRRAISRTTRSRAGVSGDGRLHHGGSLVAGMTPSRPVAVHGPVTGFRKKAGARATWAFFSPDREICADT